MCSLGLLTLAYILTWALSIINLPVILYKAQYKSLITILCREVSYLFLCFFNALDTNLLRLHHVYGFFIYMYCFFFKVMLQFGHVLLIFLCVILILFFYAVSCKWLVHLSIFMSVIHSVFHSDVFTSIIDWVYWLLNFINIAQDFHVQKHIMLHGKCMVGDLC